MANSEDDGDESNIEILPRLLIVGVGIEPLRRTAWTERYPLVEGRR
jgi:hypothetical protein